MSHILVDSLGTEILGSEKLYLPDCGGLVDKDVVRIQKSILEENGLESGGLVGIENKFLRIIKANVVSGKK